LHSLFWIQVCAIGPFFFYPFACCIYAAATYYAIYPVGYFILRGEYADENLNPAHWCAGWIRYPVLHPALPVPFRRAFIVGTQRVDGVMRRFK